MCSAQSHISENTVDLSASCSNKPKNELIIKLIEPSIILRGDPQEAPGTYLRGHLTLILRKSCNIKKLEIKFYGRAKTFWVTGAVLLLLLFFF